MKKEGFPKFKLKTALALNRSFEYMSSGISSVVQGINLGILNPDELSGLTSNFYSKSNRYCNKEYNLGGLYPWEEHVIDEFFSNSKSLLVAACGGGRETLSLLKKGYQVDAFDCLGSLVEEAKELVSEQGFSETNVYLAKPNEFPNVLPTYDAIIVGWGGYMHIPSRELRVDFLKSANALLAIEDPILVSFFCRNREARKYKFAKNIANGIRKVRGIAETVELGDTALGFFDHHFTEEEIESELNDAGFKLEYFSSFSCGHAVATKVKDFLRG